ncbi:putative indole-3-pyruvate monooxygenase [Helianthus debilis subsp. tardiflorus]
MTTGVEQTVAIVVGAGPAGLSTAASLHKLSIPYILLEREDCIASLFNKKAFDRFHLHLPKRFCQLAHMPFPPNLPTFVPRAELLKYYDDYACRFEIKPKFGNLVKSAKYDEEDRKIWKVETKIVGDGDGGGVRCYEARYLVVATGENCEPFIPEVDGLSEFKGEVIHSTQYKSGKKYENKNVLVVGAGNSGMEVAHDLSEYGAKTSIVVRSPIHIISKWSVTIGLLLLKKLSLNVVDTLLVWSSKLMYGDITKYGMQRPKEGPFLIKVRTNKYPVIDMGVFENIKSGKIQVLPALKRIKSGGDEVVFENGKCYQFDTIIFATGFKTSTHLWLQGNDWYFNKDGTSKAMFPNNWKGENGFYCAGLAGTGLIGAAMDAQKIADDIFNLISK